MGGGTGAAEHRSRRPRERHVRYLRGTDLRPERPAHVSPLEYDAYDVLTFDTYGTLIDWETGLVAALHTALGTAADVLGDDDLLTCFAGVEHEAEAPGTRYRDVLAIALREVAAELGTTVSEAQAATFGASVADWPAFLDSAEALQRLHARFALATITNCDDDLFAASEKRLGVSFDLVVTAQQVGRYKPDPAGFHVAFERIERELGMPKERILHVAQSLFHDHVTAKRLGMRTVWIDRRDGRAGGATPAAAPVEPDARFATMREFAAVALRESSGRSR
jgi:2-haloacid dehalogenase